MLNRHRFLSAVTAALLLSLSPFAFAGLITQSGPRHFTSQGGGGGEWADVYITDTDDIGNALQTDGQIVGIEVGTDINLLAPAVTSGNGGSLQIITNGSFDGQENAVRMNPPTQGPGDSYVAWLNALDIWDGATNDIAQMNFRVLVYYGPRYFDLAANSKSWGFMASTVLGTGGDENNRMGVFDYRDPLHSNWKFPYATVTTVSIYCNPVQGTFIEECPDANKLIEIRGGSANHSASPPQTGGEWICFEHVVDVRQNRGNANGLVRLLVSTRDGLVSERFVEAPLTHDAGWDFAARYIFFFEGVGFYFNDIGTANADSYVLYSHATFAANMANTNTLIGCDNIPGWSQ